MSDLTDAQIKNEGLHAFVFVDEVDPQTDFRQAIAAGAWAGARQGALRSRGGRGVRWASSTSASMTDDLPGLQDLIFRELWDLGIRCSHCLEIKTGRQGVKRDTPDDHRDLQAPSAA